MPPIYRYIAVFMGAVCCSTTTWGGSRSIPVADHINMEVTWIPPGTFMMGTLMDEPYRDGDEGPPRKVTITSGFFMGTFEVTQRQFEAVMGYNPSAFQQDDLAPDRPVESVSWLECQEFIRRLNLSGNGTFRLPTEAEWEYACRAGTNTSYYWGEISEYWEAYRHAWTNSRSFATTHPVGTKPANPWGLHDMSGNVWEWCSDWYGPYSNSDEIDPRGPVQGKEKVFRGGSYYDFPNSLRSGNRHRHSIDRGYTAIGFRLVWEPADSAPEAIRVFYLEQGLPLELVQIPAGEFVMGSPDSELGRQQDEGPQHRVEISRPFHIGRFEITQAQWRAVMGANPSTFQRAANAGLLPVERVTWHDAMAFVTKLNSRFPGTFTLPTEAEWEYACRAGNPTRYPWGNDTDPAKLNQHAWFNSRAEGQPHPVGRKLPNAWGLYDMHGNVWEWCMDGPRTYGSDPNIDPVGPIDGEHPVIRGGSWFNEPESLRSANRHRHPPDSCQTNNGFRVVWRAD